MIVSAFAIERVVYANLGGSKKCLCIKNLLLVKKNWL